GLVRARVRGPVFAGGAHRPEPRSTALVHIVFAVAWRPGALDLVSLRAGVRLGGGEVASRRAAPAAAARHPAEHSGARFSPRARARLDVAVPDPQDRKSTRLNSSHVSISYAVFCLKKKNKYTISSIL